MNFCLLADLSTAVFPPSWLRSRASLFKGAGSDESLCTVTSGGPKGVRIADLIDLPLDEGLVFVGGSALSNPLVFPETRTMICNVPLRGYPPSKQLAIGSHQQSTKLSSCSKHRERTTSPFSSAKNCGKVITKMQVLLTKIPR